MGLESQLWLGTLLLVVSLALQLIAMGSRADLHTNLNRIEREQRNHRDSLHQLAQLVVDNKNVLNAHARYLNEIDRRLRRAEIEREIERAQQAALAGAVRQGVEDRMGKFLASKGDVP